MGSVLKVDTIQGAAAASDITVNSENITVNGEGGTATTNLQQGLAKSWAINDHTTPEVLDSFNQSGYTDTSTGVLTWSTTNNFLSVNWTAAANLHADNANNAYSMVHSGTRTGTGAAIDKATTGTSWYAKNSSHSGFDSELAGHMAFGDLA